MYLLSRLQTDLHQTWQGKHLAGPVSMEKKIQKIRIVVGYNIAYVVMIYDIILPMTSTWMNDITLAVMSWIRHGK